MANEIYKKVEQFIIDTFTQAKIETDIVHAQRTAYWIKILKSDADDALLIAGLAHDIERAFYGDWKKGADDPEFLQKHQDLSATEIEKFLIKEGADEKLIMRVKRLVAHHEKGGNEDENILCDADCLAFLEEKALRLAIKYKQENKIEEIRKRIEMVFNRISSEKAKQIVRPWYEEAIKKLEY